MPPTSPQDLYARLLLSSHPGYGYPLWTPEPSHELLMQYERRDGLKIGDIGIVSPDNGGFDVLFNLTLPRNHAFHRRHGVPEGFTFIDPSELEIQTRTNAVNSGRTISTPSVKPIGAAELSANNTPQRDGSIDLAYTFSFSSSEGALLILPSGAKAYSLLNDGLFVKQASQHGVEWYNYAVNRRNRVINYDSLYLITGFYKTHCWSVGAFESVIENEHHTARFKRVQGHGPEPAYSWETPRAFDWRAGPDIEDGHANQAVFISGLKIALRTGIIGSRRIAVEADHPCTRPIHGKLFSAMPNNSRLFDSFPRSFKRDGGRSVSQTTTHTSNQGTADSEGQPPQDTSSRDVYDGMQVEIRQVPDVPAAFHPSDAINQYLFIKEPSANIAITPDGVWMEILGERLLTLEEFEQASRLEEVLSHNYHIVSEKGVVHLERKGDPDVLGDNEPMELRGNGKGKAPLGTPMNDVSKAPGGLDTASLIPEDEGKCFTFNSAVPVNTDPRPRNTILVRQTGAGKSDVAKISVLESLTSAFPPEERIPSYEEACGTPGSQGGLDKAQHFTFLGASPRGLNTGSRPTNIVLFGQTSAGKSSIINLLAEGDVAKTSSGLKGCTLDATEYPFTFPGERQVSIFDTVGLEEPEIGVNTFCGAIAKAHQLIKDLRRTGGIDLLVFCIRAGSVTATMQQNYRLFFEVLCGGQVPLAIVVTNLEQEDIMENWWTRNEKTFDQYGIRSVGHACITSVPAHVQAYARKRAESKTILRKMLLNALVDANTPYVEEEQTWLTAILGHFRSGFSWTSTKKELSNKLEKYCGFRRNDAEKLAQMFLASN